MTDTPKSPLHGWLVLDKPRGMGSTQAVGMVKRLMREGGHAKTKVGHGGTLDPLAEGVLPIALGEATKLAGRMLDASKVYEFTVQFGRETDTLDTEGNVIAHCDVQPGFGAVEAVLAERFCGEIEQIPPAYSALKVDGARAYDLARRGEEVALTGRKVTIHAWEYVAEGFVGEWDASEQYATLRVHVSKGTYIRSLARDIALALGTRGHVTYLRRIKAGPFLEQQAISLDKLEQSANGAGLEHLLLPLEAGLDDIPALNLDPESAQSARQGRVLSGMPQSSGLYLAKLGTVPVALMEVTDGTAKVVRGFNLPDVAE
jgi:tRNA pseudouridine55 synthase